LRFSVVIPTLGRHDVLRRTLEALIDSEPPPDEVILVDADPDLSARRVVASLGHSPNTPPRFIHVPSEVGLTVQRNHGIDKTKGDIVLFLDDDVTFPPDVFARLAAAYDEPRVVGVTGQIVEPDSGRIGAPHSALRHRLLGGGREGEFTRFGYPRYLRNVDVPRDVEYMLGCFMSARREAAEHVRFDEAMGGYALGEDEDFSYRLSRLGRIRYVPDLVVHHHKLGFGSKDPRAFNRLVVRNRTYLFRKNFAHSPVARAQFGLFLALLFGHRVVNREWHGALGVLEGIAEVYGRRSVAARPAALDGGPGGGG
jgi:glucosyl-dolichyl phosphate glucuronosyltransferase